MPAQPSDIDIAQAAAIRPIGEIAERAGVPPDALMPHGQTKGKVALDFCADAAARPPGRLILVTGMSPTPAGEGKTTTSIGLADGLNRLGHRTVVCLREPSLGPVFGAKGGAAGGGYAQVIPMEEINLHFTGDFHAISSANNLLAALIDNHLHQGNSLGLDARRVSWRRVLDLSDRALRNVVVGLGGPVNGVPRETGFDITPASEVMAIFCLSRDLADLQERLGRIVVGETRERQPVRAGDLGAAGSLAVLLRDALGPNLVQTLEGTPAFVHGGPFANIAHGCNSLLATRSALGLADFVVTEAGFGSDLGAEKFVDIKCRAGGLAPSAAVIVATLRALKVHGGVPLGRIGEPDAEAVSRGFANLARHVAIVRGMGLPPVIALNAFSEDTPEELSVLERHCAELRVPLAPCESWARGGAGGEALAAAVAGVVGESAPALSFTYPDEAPLWEKIEQVVRRVYGGEGAEPVGSVRQQLARLEEQGFGGLPVCMAKTQYSFTADPGRLGAPEGFTVPIREVRLSAGAGFVVCIAGDVLTMPGLPARPAAEQIGLTAEGRIAGLF